MPAGTDPRYIQRDREGRANPQATEAERRWQGDGLLLALWREVGYQAAADEACERHGHLRARGGLCERCGRGVSGAMEDHRARELELAARRATSSDPRLHSPPPR